jgi:hypothetical protein
MREAGARLSEGGGGSGEGAPLPRVSLHYGAAQLAVLLEAVYGGRGGGEFRRLGWQRGGAEVAFRAFEAAGSTAAASAACRGRAACLTPPPPPPPAARRVRVAPDSVAGLMEMAGYLECPMIMAACCQVGWRLGVGG